MLQHFYHNWEELENEQGFWCYRLKTPEGWLVRIKDGYGAAICFCPDKEHKWLKESQNEKAE